MNEIFLNLILVLKSQKKIDNNLPILIEKLKYRHLQSREKRERDKLGILDFYSICLDCQLFLSNKNTILNYNFAFPKTYFEANSFSFLNNKKPNPKTKTKQLNNI